MSLCEIRVAVTRPPVASPPVNERYDLNLSKLAPQYDRLRQR